MGCTPDNQFRNGLYGTKVIGLYPRPRNSYMGAIWPSVLARSAVEFGSSFGFNGVT